MSYTPVIDKMEISDDSGCISQSTLETASLFSNSCLSASCIDRLHSPFTNNVTSRKKTQHSDKNFPTSQQTKISSPENISYASPWLLGNTSNILSSTFNDSLPTNFEKFVLNSTPNYYVERSDFAEKPKTTFNTEQSTPIKHVERPQKSDYLKYCSTIKLGSPERNEILYGDTKRYDFLHKPKTPQKFYDRTKRYSPAKKRLFGLIRKPTKVDPIQFFLNNKRQFPNVVSKILSYVPDSDLSSFKMVSKKWFAALEDDKASYSRYLAFIKSQTFDKENKYEWKNDSLNNSSCWYKSPVKTPVSPRRRKFNEFLEMGEMLKENQTLNKCPNCQWPAIVEKNISQCQRDACGYIHCTKCNSFSTKGPEHFVDHCQMSALKVEKPYYRPRLTDSPPSKMELSDDLPSFFQDNSFNNNYLTKSDTSGYSTDGDLCPYYKPNNSKESFGVLQECNRELVNARRSRERRSFVAAVVPLQKTKIELVEPSSPPQIKNVACSKQSKKSLKRLLR